MARPRKDARIDLSESHELTAGLIERLTCPGDRAQAFLRDAKAPGLRVRVTEAGAKSFVFEAKLNRQTIRRTIGDVRAWSIEAARNEANRLRVTLDGGDDPRELERAQRAVQAAATATTIANAVTVGEVWAQYRQARRSHWGERHYADHAKLAKEGGVSAVRGTRGRGVTVAGPLFPLMSLRLCELDAKTVEAWAEREGKVRPASARLAWRMLKVFLTWCSEQPQFASILPASNPAKTKKSREALGPANVKKDVLLREQLLDWFDAVRKIQRRDHPAPGLRS